MRKSFLSATPPKFNIYHSGSVSRDSVPVWKGPASERAFRGPVTQVNMKTVHHNGSVSRDSVPVWKESVTVKAVQ